MVRFFVVFASVYLSDLITKIVVRDKMFVGQEIRILPFFSLTHVENTGIAFGLFQDRNIFFAVLGLVLTVVIFRMAYRLKDSDHFSTLVLGVVLGGALGNITDRLLRGRVTDFLDFYIGMHHWPAFNIADSAICVGAALLLWKGFTERKDNHVSSSI